MNDLINHSLKFFVIIVIVALFVENLQGYENAETPFSITNIQNEYLITFNENGLSNGSFWSIKVIINNSKNITYSSRNSTIEFDLQNGSYNYIALASDSYFTTNASGYLNVSGNPITLTINFHRTPVSEYYQPYIIMNISQERTFSLDPQLGAAALDFGVMNTTIIVQVYNGTKLIYEKNITGEPTNFNPTMITTGYAYVNFQSHGSLIIYATNVGNTIGYFSLDLWNYYISNSSAALITLPPHFQEIFGTGYLNRNIGAFMVTNNTGMSFTLVAPYYKDTVPLSIWIGEGYYNIENGKYWWAQLGFDNYYNGSFDVSYGGWGAFSNFGPAVSGVDHNFPLVPNQTYNFTMETVANGSWEFLINNKPVCENGSPFYNAPTNFANGNACLGIEVPLYSSLNNLYNGSIIIPNVISYRVNGTWEKAKNISFLYGECDWEDGHGGSFPGLNIWGIEGNIQNKSIPPGEMILNNGPNMPYEVPSGISYDVYPISGNFSFPWQNISKYGNFLNVTEEPNCTLLLNPEKPNTEVSILKFENDSNVVYSDQNMIISKPMYIENPAIDFKAAICAVPLDNYTSAVRYNGIFQEIALEPILPSLHNGVEPFSIGNSSTSYSGQIFIPVYFNGYQSIYNLLQVYSFDPYLLKFNGILPVPSSQYVSFSFKNLSNGMLEIDATGNFIPVSNHTLLFYLVFDSIVKEQASTEILLDESSINGFEIIGNSSSRITLSAGWDSIGPKDIYIQNGSLPIGGMASSIGYSPTNLSILYAASGQNYPLAGPFGYPGDTGSGGIIKSINGGKTWSFENLGLTSTAITDISVDPENPNIVVVESRGMNGANPLGGGIFKTINGGLSWEETYGLGGYELQYVSGVLYATTFHSILKSFNFGTTWITVANFSDIVTSSLILDNGSKIYVGVWSYGTDRILESDNYGLNFRIIANFTQSEFSGKQPSISQIIANPNNNSNMWAIIDSPYLRRELGNPSLYRSMDGGSTWQQVNTSAIGLGLQQEPPSFITYDPVNGSIMYVTGLSGLYKSTDGGNYFFQISGPNGFSFPGMISIDQLNDNIIFLCSETGLFESFDQGNSWSSVSNFSTNLLLDLAVDGHNIFATNEGLSPLYSNSSGKSWTTICRGYLGVVAVDPYNSSIVMMWTETHAIGPFFFVSNNGGNSFFLPNINFTSLVNPNVNDIAFSKNEIFVPGGAGIFISTDNGLIWSLLNDSPTYAYTVIDSPMRQNILYASNNSGLFESNNYGISWFKINPNYFQSIAVDPFNSSILASTIPYGSPYSFSGMISYDGGRTFESLGIYSSEYELSSPYIYFYNISGKPILVFISDQGVYVSENFGSTWLNYTYNLPSTLINSFYAGPNETAYLATYGSGIFVDPEFFNFTFYKNVPILTGYLPRGTNLTLNGVNITNAGYFSIKLKAGYNILDFEGKIIYLNTSRGNVYFLNFTNMQISLKINEKNLPPGTEWTLIVKGKNYYLIGNETIALPPGSNGVYVLPVSADYSIYYPINNFYPLNSSLLFSTITVQFVQATRASYYNITSAMKGMFWSTQIAYNMGYILYAGGTLGLFNITMDKGSILYIPNFNGLADSVVPFQRGFIIGGDASPNRPGIYYYNISSGLFVNYSSLLPTSWNAQNSMISSIFVINSTTFGFIGGGVDSAYFGIIERNTFINLTPYLPPSFIPISGLYNRYSGAYLSSYKALVISDGNDIGVFYLENKTFKDLSQLMPSSFFIGSSGNVWTPSNDFISSNNSTAVITGTDSSGPFTVLYKPGIGIRDISGLFPQSEYIDTLSFRGKDIILSGYNSAGNSSSIFIYNTSKETVSIVNTTYYGNTSLIDSAILVQNNLYFTTFNVKQVPNENYVVFMSYYGGIKLTPTGNLDLKVNALSTIEINNETFYAKNVCIPEFTGRYNLSIYSPGFATYTTSVYILPFENFYLNVTLEQKRYEIIFVEKGLEIGTSWSISLNGTIYSSTNNSIIFYEQNGSYTYAIITPINGSADIRYISLNSSGTVIVNGKNVTVDVSYKTQYYLTMIVTPFNGGSISPSSGWYNAGSIVTINAIPNNNFEFISWSGSGNGSYSGNDDPATIAMNGPVTEKANFTELYNMTFKESGLPSGTSWSVTLNGVTETSTNSTITFHEPYGTYSYSISLPSGYKTSSSSGTIKTSQPSLIIPITVSSTSPSSSTSYLIYIIIAIVVIVAVIGAVLATKRGKK